MIFHMQHHHSSTMFVGQTFIFLLKHLFHYTIQPPFFLDFSICFSLFFHSFQLFDDFHSYPQSPSIPSFFLGLVPKMRDFSAHFLAFGTRSFWVVLHRSGGEDLSRCGELQCRFLNAWTKIGHLGAILVLKWLQGCAQPS